MSRICHYLLVLLLVVGLNFFLPRLLPGDPLSSLYGEHELILTPEFRHKLIEHYGLQGSWMSQFSRYLGNLGHGDLGYSLYYQAPVAQVMGRALIWTALLCGSSFLISTILGFLLGLELAWRRRQAWTMGIIGVCLVLETLPGFLVGLFLLILFSLKLGLFPLSGALDFNMAAPGLASQAGNIAWHLILPALSLTLGEIPAVALLLRNSALKNLASPFILAARARGLGELRLKYLYLGGNALLPLITRLGLRFGLLFTGALPVEIVFAYPGAGQLLYQALLKRDYPLLQGICLVITLAVLAGNALADLGYRWADPRLRSQGAV